MSNIIKFPTKIKYKSKNFHRLIKPAQYFTVFLGTTVIVAILTAITGPAAFLIMAVTFMIYTMIYLP